MANFYVSSGTSFSATISITYPAGSTCTVSNYKKTWTAPNTTGSWTFKANEVGHYTVKAVSGSKSKEKEVLITSEGQLETVTLSYELVLFDGGDNTGITGGWEGNGVTPTVSNVLSFSFTNYDTTFAKAASIFTRNKFDLSKYDKLTVVKSTANGWYIGVTENVFSWGTYPPGVAEIGFIAYSGLNTSDARIEIDISGINTECYVAIYQRAASSNPETTPKTFSATLTNITLS